jgi:hypothetical protein
VVAASLTDLRGPAAGPLELPLHLFWSGPDAGPAVFDLDTRHDALAAYKTVLGEARTCEDIAAHLNAGLLAALWTALHLPAETRQAWESAHPALRAAGHAAAA